MHTRALSFEYYCKLATMLSVIVIVLSACIYVTCLMLAVGRTEVRARAEASNKEIGSELGSVQAKYVAALQSVTPERAAALGLIQPAPADITYVDTAARMFSLNALNVAR